MRVHGGGTLGDDGDLLCGRRVDDAEAGIALIHDQEGLSVGAASEDAKRKATDQQAERAGLSHEKHYRRISREIAEVSL
jgi:hypothetical protein